MFAIPITTVKKMTGVIIMRMSLMKTSPRGFNCSPAWGAKMPTRTPRTMPTITRKYRVRKKRRGVCVVILNHLSSPVPGGSSSALPDVLGSFENCASNGRDTFHRAKGVLEYRRGEPGRRPFPRGGDHRGRPKGEENP